MTEQTIYDLALLISGRPKVKPCPWSNFKDCLFRHQRKADELTLGNLRKFGREFVSKNSHAVEKE